MSALPVPPADAAERLLPPDVPRDGRGVAWRGEPQAAAVWHGHVWGRLGRGDRAFAWWDTVDAPGLAAWVAAEQARVLRELGLHTEAEAYDLAALRQATHPVDEAMAWIGLTADAVGAGALAELPLRLAAAADAVESLEDSPRAARQRLRLDWVRVEVAWATGERPEPGDVRLPERGVDGAPRFPDGYRHGSDFHRAKGLLFAGVVRGDAVLLDAAAELAPPGLAWAVHLARADAGRPDAPVAAAAAWRGVTAPPAYAEAARATPTAIRLRESSTPTTPSA